MLDDVLLTVAKKAILGRFDKNVKIQKDSLLQDYPYLKEEGASFVTLHKNNSLRGCIGSLIAHRSLLDDIISNAISAAFKDPRFSPLGEDELDALTIEVSVLSKPKLLEYKDYEDLKQKIKPNIDGVILQSNFHSGTFLPQVWQELGDVDEFLEHLSYKAGANISIYQTHPNIYTYNVEAIERDFNEIL